MMVILYHLQIPWVLSGFVGVDVFFVISGFLITSHIQKEIIVGQFNLTSFYLKRIRRILPALLFVLIITSIVAYLILIPKDLLQYSKSLLCALLSGSNIYFYKSLNFGYFSSDSTVIPLLHTWSLGVEEQFYLVWPLIFVLFYNRLQNKGFTFITLILAAISYGVFISTNTDYSYYMPTSRAFELLSGAILALIIKDIKVPNNTVISDVASILFLIVLLSIGFFATPKSHPGLVALMVCFSTIGLISLGKNKRIPLANQVLSTKPFAYIGLISYSIYLWHWPIIAYINYTGIELSASVDLMVIVSVIILSIFSYNHIEKPFRYKSYYGLRASASLFILLPAACSFCFFFACTNIKNFGYNTISQKQYEQANTYYGILKKNDGCIDSKTYGLNFPDLRKCTIGELSNRSPQVLVVGDSHAMAYVGMLNVLLKDASISAQVVTQSGSPFILGAGITSWRENNPIERNKQIASLISHSAYQYVVLGGFWNYYPALPSKSIAKPKPFEVLEKGLTNAVKFIIAQNSTPIFIFDNPSTKSLKRYCGLTKWSFRPCHNSRESLINEQKKITEIIGRIKKAYPKVQFIDPSDIICTKKHCNITYKGTPLYMSDGVNRHLSFTGSQIIGKLYLKKFGNPFLNA
jgi:peptidoglycan/LPS O-acetylase OafA/YrhL